MGAYVCEQILRSFINTCRYILLYFLPPQIPLFFFSPMTRNDLEGKNTVKIINAKGRFGLRW